MRLQFALFVATGGAFEFNVPPSPEPDLASYTPLKKETLPNTVGTCETKAINGDTVKVHYTGWSLATGAKFDSSYDRKSPLEFQLGTGRVIRGWDEGIDGMCIGEKRRLTIASDMAYGSRGHPPVIQPSATLVFDVELVNVNRKSEL